MEAFAWAVDLAICVLPREGLFNDPGSEQSLAEACEIGVDPAGSGIETGAAAVVMER